MMAKKPSRPQTANLNYSGNQFRKAKQKNNETAYAVVIPEVTENTVIEAKRPEDNQSKIDIDC